MCKNMEAQLTFAIVDQCCNSLHAVVLYQFYPATSCSVCACMCAHVFRFDKLVYLGVSKDKNSQLKIITALTRKYVVASKFNVLKCFN